MNTPQTPPSDQGQFQSSNNPSPPSFQYKQNKLHRLGRFKSAFSTIAILIIAPLIALTLTAFVFQSYEVDGPSMETTLSNHDRLIVLKTQRTWARITRHPYIPNRGDVIIFNQGGLETTSNQKQLIKRVVALPRERVVVKDGTLTIHNGENPDGFEPDKILPYGKDIPPTSGNVDITLGDDQVFVVGDNRPNSLDSRSFGAISADDIVGKLAFRILPLGNMEVF